MKILEPKINKIDDYKLIDAYNENYYNEMLFNENIESNIVISSVTIDGCIFKDIDFNNIEFDDVEFLDVVFENCDLSNEVFDYNLMQRVKFINCRMIGMSFITSSFNHFVININIK